MALNYDVTREMKARAAERGVTSDFMLVEPDPGALAAIRALVVAGKLRPTIDTVLPLSEAAKGHELGRRTGLRGSSC